MELESWEWGLGNLDLTMWGSLVIWQSGFGKLVKVNLTNWKIAMWTLQFGKVNLERCSLSKVNLDFTTCPPTNGKSSIPYLFLGFKNFIWKKKACHFSLNPVKKSKIIIQKSCVTLGVGARVFSFFSQNFDKLLFFK